MAAGGYTPDEIDAMPARDAFSLIRYWRDHPPTNEILAAYFPLAPVPPRDADDPSGIGHIIAAHPDGLVK